MYCVPPAPTISSATMDFINTSLVKDVICECLFSNNKLNIAMLKEVVKEFILAGYPTYAGDII